MQFAASESYRYGFNGKENDREWGTASLTQDYGFRLYNPAIAKFLSVDPLAPEYPWYTPYQFAGNMPISCIDLDGLENLYYQITFNVKTRKSVVTLQKSEDEWLGPHIYVLYKGQEYYRGDPPPSWLKTLTGSDVTAESMVNRFADKTEAELDEFFSTQRNVQEMRKESLERREESIKETLEAGFMGALRNKGKKSNKIRPIITPEARKLEGSDFNNGAVSKLKPSGSGPFSGVIEVSDRVKSIKAFKNYRPKQEYIEYIYDTKQKIFLVGQPSGPTSSKFKGYSGHEKLASLVNGNGKDIVGGMFVRGKNNEIILNEFSGHFWQNWNDANRKEVQEFLEKKTGQKVIMRD